MPGRCQGEKNKLFNKTESKRTVFFQALKPLCWNMFCFPKKRYLTIKSFSRMLPHRCERSLPPATKSLMLEFVKVTQAAPGCCCRENPAGGALTNLMGLFPGNR